jgi:hypothetical protein
MSGEYGYIVRLLRKLEFLLAQQGEQREAGRMGQIVQRIARADDVRAAVKGLYAVEGYDRLALRLLYYADTLGPLLTELPDDRLIEYHVEQLHHALQNPEGLPLVQRPTRRPPSQSLSGAIDQFVGSLRELRRGAEKEEGVFERIQSEHLRLFLQKAQDLGTTAEQENAGDVARFASSVGTFVRYVLDRSLFDDVRVVNILDNAVLTLQTVLPSIGADDFDSLTQTIQLLADPATLLE